MSPGNAGERTRPVMEYVQQLETKVRYFQNQERRFRARWFFCGFLVGVVVVFAAGWVK